MYNIPCTNDLLKQTHVPFALVLSPFAQQAQDEVRSSVYCSVIIIYSVLFITVGDHRHHHRTVGCVTVTAGILT